MKLKAQFQCDMLAQQSDYKMRLLLGDTKDLLRLGDLAGECLTDCEKAASLFCSRWPMDILRRGYKGKIRWRCVEPVARS